MRKCIGAILMITMVMPGGMAWGAMQVVADFEDGVSLFDYTDPTHAANTIAASTDTPAGTSGYSCKVTATNWYQWEAPEDTTAESYCGLEFSPGLDMSGYAYLNFYIKGTSTQTITSFWNSSIIGAGANGMGYGHEPSLPAAWTYVSVPIAEFESWWGTAHNMSATWHLEWGFSMADVGTMELYVDHVTLSDTPEEGMLPEGPAPEVLADFEDESGLDYFSHTQDTAPSDDTVSDDSLWCTTYGPTENPDYGGSYNGLLFEPNKDFSAQAYVNFYIKATGTPAENCYVQGITQDWGGAMAWSLPNPLPTSWTYVSLALSDAENWWGDAHDWTAVWKLEFAMDGPVTAGETIYIDHVTLTSTPEQGRLTPKDCGTPYLARPSQWVEEGSPLTISLAGVNPDCLDSVSWTRDGVPVGGDEPCATITPAGAVLNDEVSIALLDSMGNPIDMTADAGYAEVGFKKNGAPEPITIRIDHMTLTDSSAAGMLGAGSGLIYVLSDCEEDDMLGWTAETTVKTFSTDAAGAGSTGSVQLECPADSEIWSEWYDAEWGGAGPYNAAGATHFNFYLKVVSGVLPVGTLVQIGTAEAQNEWWEAGGGEAALEDGLAFPAVGGDWAYVSIPISSMTVNGTFDLSFLRAAGFKWTAAGSPDVYTTFNNGDNPEMFTTGEAVLTLTQDMVDSYYAWIWAETSGAYMEFFPLADALADGYDCGSPIFKSLDGVSNLGLTFSIVSESDSGTYCAAFSLNGEPTEVCTTIEVVGAGSLPAAGIIGLGMLALSSAVAGLVALRRKH